MIRSALIPKVAFALNNPKAMRGDLEDQGALIHAGAEMNTHITVSKPMIIGPRLIPAVRVGDAMISIEPVGRTPDNRLKVRWFIDVGGKEYTKDDLASGVGGQWSTAMARRMMGDLLAFLGAFAEAGDEDENADLFPVELREWAQQHEDDITTIRNEIEGE